MWLHAYNGSWLYSFNRVEYNESQEWNIIITTQENHSNETAVMFSWWWIDVKETLWGKLLSISDPVIYRFSQLDQYDILSQLIWHRPLIYDITVHWQVSLVKKLTLGYEGESGKSHIDIRTGEDFTPFLLSSSPYLPPPSSRSKSLRNSWFDNQG